MFGFLDDLSMLLLAVLTRKLVRGTAKDELVFRGLCGTNNLRNQSVPKGCLLLSGNSLLMTLKYLVSGVWQPGPLRMFAYGV